MGAARAQFPARIEPAGPSLKRLTEDPALRRLVELSRELGVPLRRLQGWEPSERTSYEYDEATGRLSSSTTTLDPEWSNLDRAWLEALLYLEHHTGEHGHPMWEALSPEADPNNPEARFRYVAGTPTIDPEGRVVMAATFDWAEKERRDFLDRMRGDDPDPMNGVIVPVQRVPRTPTSERRSPLDRWKAKRRALAAAPPPKYPEP